MKDIAEKLWFKRRRYGWGWTPVTWQGWLTTVILLAVVFASSFTIPMKPHEPTTGQIILFFMYAGSAILVLLGISFMKGPTPRFRWGRKPTDNPEEDI